MYISAKTLKQGTNLDLHRICDYTFHIIVEVTFFNDQIKWPVDRWRSGRCRHCCSDFCFSVPAILNCSLDRSRHLHPLTVFDFCNGTRTESSEESLNCRFSSTARMSTLPMFKKPSWPTRLSRWIRPDGQLSDLTVTTTSGTKFSAENCHWLS